MSTVVFIDSRGRFAINGEQLVNNQADTLLRVLRETAGSDKDPRVIINADKNATHQTVMTAMDASRQAGFVHLTFSAVKPE